MKECKPSCFDCIHGKLIPGEAQTYWHPGEQDAVECRHPHFETNWIEATEQMFSNFNEEELPEKCGKFEPILIEKCSCRACNKIMNVPRWSHNIWASTYDEPVPVCSKSCKDAIEVEIKFEEIG